MSFHLARPAARLALLLTVALLALPAGAALGQASPFGNLPPGTPEQAPPPQSTSFTPDDGLDTWQIALIVIGGIGLLTGIVVAVLHDARRRAPVSVGDDEAAHLAADAHKGGQAAKKKQRAKSKAAREQRRRNR